MWVKTALVKDCVDCYYEEIGESCYEGLIAVQDSSRWSGHCRSVDVTVAEGDEGLLVPNVLREWTTFLACASSCWFKIYICCCFYGESG